MSDTPRVSIILPFYNSEKTLRRAIESIVNQSFTDIELLLVDNNSIDRSSDIATEFSEQDKRIRLLRESRQGVVFAANKGLSKSMGEYIARMDADDVSHPDRISKQAKALDENQGVGLVSSLVNYIGSDVNEGFRRYVDWSNGIKSTQELTLNQFVEYPMVNPTIMMRRECYLKHGGYEQGQFPEDYEYFLRLQLNGVKMKKLSAVLLDWYDLPGRLTRNDNKYSLESFFKIKARYLAKWLEVNNPKHPEVTIWGGGKLAKRRSSYLLEYGVEIISFIDIKKSKNKSSIYYKEVGSLNHSFILSFVANWGARDEIRKYLNEKGFKEGPHYLICA